MFRLALDHLKRHFIGIDFDFDDFFYWLNEPYNKYESFWFQIGRHYSVFLKFFNCLVRENDQPFDLAEILDVYYMTMILFVIRLPGVTEFGFLTTFICHACRPFSRITQEPDSCIWKHIEAAPCGIGFNAIARGMYFGETSEGYLLDKDAFDFDLPQKRMDELRFFLVTVPVRSRYPPRFTRLLLASQQETTVDTPE